MGVSNTGFDLVIIGGGIVGAACASAFIDRYPKKRVLLLEKESGPAQHQTGRNSGVIHAGVYYAPGSLKAKFCRQGLERTISFCQQYDLPYLQCGKMLVATDEDEVKRMHTLAERCLKNDLNPELIDKAGLSSREPNVSGLAGMYIQQTGITDYAAITHQLLTNFIGKGGEVQFDAYVSGVDSTNQGIELSVGDKKIYAVKVLNCAGVYSDRIAKAFGLQLDCKIVPFRGEYFRLPSKFNQIVNHLIYPIPDPELPFLGVHLTRMIDGSVTVGPNAVLAMARDGYRKTHVSLQDMAEMLSFSGLRKVVAAYPKHTLAELKNSFSKRGYLKQVHKYCGHIQLSDLQPYRSGIRAQAVSYDGQLIHDFKFAETDTSLHIVNAPSPAATSAMPIADYVVEKLAGSF